MIVCQFPPVFLIMVMKSVSKFGYETTSLDTSGLLTDSIRYSVINYYSSSWNEVSTYS